ncbi:MAG: NADH-quinone oxidoreductase subunit NuoE [Anaerohalosphaeraceae bacterium]|nr:NADH-quinone oxidoreductase subunit NuoE [Anaerohalosphaeraceae bacterium]
MSVVRKILEKHSQPKRETLIPILQEIQEELGYLSREAICEVGEKLNLSASKIYGVATFYNQFRFEKAGLYEIQVCRGTACHVKGSASVLEALKQELQIEPGGTTRDGLFNLEVVACIGACSLAPVIAVNGEFHAGVSPDSIKEILNTYRERVVENDQGK